MGADIGAMTNETAAPGMRLVPPPRRCATQPMPR
jgi:hypothetical protein